MSVPLSIFHTSWLGSVQMAVGRIADGSRAGRTHIVGRTVERQYGAVADGDVEVRLDLQCLDA
eukprot:scaffold46489_cov54-Phaeocystis_antarctica.AAC.1